MNIPNGVARNIPQLLILAINIQVDARPATKQGQRTINRAQTAIILELLLGLLLRLANNRTNQSQELNLLRIPAVLRLRQLTNLRNILRHDRRTMPSNKDRLGVLRRKRLACLRRPRLQNHRRALRTRLR